MIIFRTLCSKTKSQAFTLTAYREHKINRNEDYDVIKQNCLIQLHQSSSLAICTKTKSILLKCFFMECGKNLFTRSKKKYLKFTYQTTNATISKKPECSTKDQLLECLTNIKAWLIMPTSTCTLLMQASWSHQELFMRELKPQTWPII